MTIIKHFCVLSGVLALAASCSDETFRKIDVEKNRGNEVAFSAMAESLKANNTRTYYGDYNSENKSYPIYWASKDNIVVASPMGETGHDHAVYHIVVPTTAEGDTVYGGASYAKDIVLNDQYSPDGGVRWGDAKSGSFYAIYPYSAETLRRPAGMESIQPITRYYNSINLKDKDADGKDVVTATAKVENVQRIWAPDGTKYNKDTGLLQMYGSNHALVMWAQTDNVKSGDKVNLRFKPLSTCLMMTFSCADLQDVANHDATIEKITITALDKDKNKVDIAGNMKIQFPESSTEGDPVPTEKNGQTFSKGTPSWTLDAGSGSNTIEIIPWIRSNDMESGIHPTIEPGQSMQICAFLLPNTYTDISNWTISVDVSGSTYTRSLKPSNTGENDNENVTLLPGQIHEMKFPAFNVATEWNFSPNSWMADIPANTYLSQITFPGAWEFWSQEAQQKAPYQGQGFKGLIGSGIRAFDLKTRTYTNPTTNKKSIVLSGTVGGDEANGTTVGKVIADIADHIKEQAKEETMVIVLRYEPVSGDDGGSLPEDYAYWMYGLVQEYLSAKANYGDILYAGEITPETTLGDVRGKVIIKINLDDEVCKNWPTTGDYVYGSSVDDTNTLPALISYSPLRWVTESDVYDPVTEQVLPKGANFTYESLTSMLGWKGWNGFWNQKLINGLPKDRPTLYAWNFSCTDRTYAGDTGDDTGDETSDVVTDGGLPTMRIRQGALDKLKDEAIAVYNEGYHNEWFLFGCGGMYAETTTSTVTDAEITNFTSKMNPWLNKQIKALFTENKPCPLGIVFFNQVGNTTYEGDEILTNLIKMNKAFYLQQKPESTTPASAPMRTRAENSKSKTESNGWTVYRP